MYSCIYVVAVADHKQQLLAELELTGQLSQAENQILKLEEELQAKQKYMASLSGQIEQQQRELERLKQQGKARVYGADSTCISVMYSGAPSRGQDYKPATSFVRVI